MNRLTRHVSVDGQTVIRTCANGSLNYHKYQDIEAEVEETVENGLPKKLVATTASSRYEGIRRRMEGMTLCSQDETPTHKDQEDEWVKGKGEGRPSLKHIDGDVPMCMRNKDEEHGLESKQKEKSSSNRAKAEESESKGTSVVSNEINKTTGEANR